MVSRIDDFGTPAAYNHYAVGWAHAMDTPYQWTKQIASHWGGTRNGTIVHWPAGIKATGEIRSQFHHVIDVAADGARGGRPTRAAERQRRPAAAARGRLDGLHVRRRRRGRPSHDAVLRDVLQPRHLPRGLDCRHPAQHSLGCDRDARVRRRRVGALRPRTTGRRRTTSPATTREARELQRLFLIEAAKYNVLPLDDRRFERFNPDLAGRPQLVTGTSQLLFGGMGRLSENSVVAEQEQVVRDHGRDRRARRRRRGRDHRPGRRVRRLLALRQGREAGVLLQPLRPPAVQGLRGRPDPRGRAPGADGVHLRRRRPRARAATSRSTSTARRSAAAASTATVPMLFSADETTDVGATPRRR